MATKLPLDPRKSPWKRGDVCTLDFKKNGFVLSHTMDYLEVRWMGNEGIEKIPTENIEDVLRVAHADSPSGTDGKTNLEALEAIESLSRIRNAMDSRMKSIKSDGERREVDALIKRSFNPECTFDRKHTKLLFDLAIDPVRVNLYWKLRERWHRFIHHH